ncbi:MULTISPECIES: hypothetical protein [Providencia]|uniref:hypothetical protein n=1 Tax=Providencia TaxID=586 RepID=UPI0024815A54|nr:hypothetical protein [Providencia rettgeri]
MAKNEFLPFGIAEGANVLSNQEYERLAARFNGFISGVAKSKELNTVWRQSSIISSAIAQFVVDSDNKDLLDNGDVAGIKNRLVAAIKQTISGVGYVTTAAMNLELNKKIDKASISGVLGNDNSKVPSLNLLTTELGKKQPSGDYLRVGDYGIGGELPPQVTDANDAKKGGIYSPAGAAGVNFYDPYAPMFVMNRNGVYIRQFQITPAGKIAARDIKGEWKVYSDDEELKTRFLGINSTAVSAKQLSTKSIIAGQEFYGKGETITITPQGIGAQPSGNYLKPGDYGIGTAYPPSQTDANSLVINGIYSGGGAGGKNYFDPYAPIFVMTRDNKYICHMQVNLQGRIGTRYGNGAWNTYPTLDEFNAKKSLGEGQRWQDVKASRSSGVSYTNTTGRTIALYASSVGQHGSSNLIIYVDDVLCSDNAIGGGAGFDVSRHSIGYTIIPAGSTYRVVASSIATWAELR